MTQPMHTPAPPFNRWGTRLNHSTGGPYPARQAWAQQVNAETQINPRPDNLNDGAISRERMPYFRTGYYTGTGSLVNWTACGPARPSLHMRDVTMRRMAGTSNTRAQDPVPAGPGIQDGNGSLPGGIRNLNSSGIEVPTNNTPHGLHTRVKGAVTRQSTVRRLSGAAQMRPGRQNRLSNSTGQGQSFSQTTIHQGGGRRR